MWDFRKPAGMECLEAVRRIFWKESSPVEQEVGRKIVVLSHQNNIPSLLVENSNMF